MSSSNRNYASGLLMLTLGTGLVLMVVVLLGWSPDVDRIRLVIRATARTSLAFFLLAYTASAVHALWPSELSSWIRLHRRQWGLLFVLSHTLHAGAIVSLAVTAPDLFQTLAPSCVRHGTRNEGESNSSSARVDGSSLESSFSSNSMPAILHSSHPRSDQDE